MMNGKIIEKGIKKNIKVPKHNRARYEEKNLFFKIQMIIDI